ncbi:MAG TPA: hypothetical protein VG711_06730, partial [Phycisphaerales bacterium]|nr:hypothetical protein [Phycisphaerales bacterium]
MGPPDSAFDHEALVMQIDGEPRNSRRIIVQYECSSELSEWKMSDLPAGLSLAYRYKVGDVNFSQHTDDPKSRRTTHILWSGFQHNSIVYSLDSFLVLLL